MISAIDVVGLVGWTCVTAGTVHRGLIGGMHLRAQVGRRDGGVLISAGRSSRQHAVKAGPHGGGLKVSGHSTIVRVIMTSTLNTEGESMPPSRTSPVKRWLEAGLHTFYPVHRRSGVL